VEASISTKLANWDLTINADVLSAENIDTGIELDDRAEQTLFIAASRDFGQFDIAFKVKSESDRFDNRGTEVSSYTLFDVSASYDITDKIKLYANVDNIFDKDYTVNLIGASERYNTEGRQAKLSLKVKF